MASLARKCGKASRGVGFRNSVSGTCSNRPAWNPRATTAAHMAARLKLYVACSGALDTTMPAIEKNSASAKNLQRLRSRIREPMEPDVPRAMPAPGTLGGSD